MSIMIEDHKKQTTLQQDILEVSLAKTIITSREADNRENILFRQGRGQFHVSSSGHEGVAGIAPLIKLGDRAYSYYRDRSLLLHMGVSLYDMALGYFAKAESSSGGRQMVNHFCYKELGIESTITPTAIQCLPAAGSAWAIKLNGTANVVFCSIGDASTRQGEFLEAINFAIQEQLPIIFIVHDNGYGISTPTEETSPLALGVIPNNIVHVLDARDPLNVLEKMTPVVENTRSGGGPAVAWLKMDRLTPHTGSDDHSKYRSSEELLLIKSRDIVLKVKQDLLSKGLMTPEELLNFESDIKDFVKQIYKEAELAMEPDHTKIREHVFSRSNKTSIKRLNFKGSFMAGEESWSMANAFNKTLDLILEENPKTLIFGQDVEDGKGGVFALTRGLSTKYPGRVTNSPLAEATIAGTASGLATSGFLPIFEIQFADFIGPAFSQIVNQIATMNWRTLGRYKCPLILYAPCGSFISGGGPWHSQTNEGWLAHAPGIKVYMPSNSNDVAQMLYSAAHGEDPVVMLLPKNQFQKISRIERETQLFPEKAKIKRIGESVSLIAWGNCVEIALMASEQLSITGIEADVVDVASIVPCDWDTLHRSVQKTGRAIVIQEDNKTCSFGQAILSELCSHTKTWRKLLSPPQLITRDDVHIGFSAILERTVLPSVEEIVNKATLILGEHYD